MVHSIEKRKEFVRLKKLKLSFKEISEIIDVSESTCRRWYDQDEQRVLNPKKTKRKKTTKSNCNVPLSKKGEELIKCFGKQFFTNSINKNYSFEMIREKIIRDLDFKKNHLVESVVLSKDSFRRSLIAVGFKVNTKEYNKMPQSWKLQYKFDKSVDVRNLCSTKSRAGQKKTVAVRKKNGSYKNQTFRREDSPFCAEFYSSRDLEDRRAEIILKGTRASSKSSGNKLEKKVEALLRSILKDAKGKEIKTQYCLLNTKDEDRRNNFLYDFYIKTDKGEFLVEVNGDYYHANPLFYNKTQKISFPGGRTVTVGDLWASDKRKQSFAVGAGYSVIVVWEHDVKYREEQVREDLCTILLK